jgi:DNA repair photolyase
MEEKLSAKSNAVEILEKQLWNRSKKKQHGIIVLSSATDPYQHAEKETKLTRNILELILKYRFPVHIITKSDLVIRDMDLLMQISKDAMMPDDLKNRIRKKVIVTFSFSTIDPSIAQIFEPGATPPGRRLDAMKTILHAGMLSGVSLMPLLPFISDTGEHLELMFSTFSEAGVDYILPASVTLFGSTASDGRSLVLRAVQKHYPHLMEKYEDYFASRTSMPSYYTTALRKKTTELSEKYGLKNSILIN